MCTSMRRILGGLSNSLVMAALLVVAPGAAQAQTPPALTPLDMSMTMPGTFTLVSVGDLIIRRPVSNLEDEDIQAALRLIREGDVAVGNLEGSLADYSTFEGPLRGFVGSAEVAADLKAIGFDMVNRANNHLFDSESEGMFETNRLLDEAGIVHAGTGKNLNEAAAPAYLEIPKGRVALVGMHTPNGVASLRLAATSQTGNLYGRPGLNMLDYSEEIVLTQDQLEDLRRIRDELLEHRHNYDNPRSAPRNLGPDQVNFYSSSSGREDPIYRVAQPGEIPGTIDFTLNRNDLDRVLRSIRNAKQYSDFVIATIHSHQSQSVVENFHLSTRPPAFYVDLAHRAVDAGADAFVGHGVHTLRGVEIYGGKPIFYGMGEFFRQMNWSLETQLGMRDVSPTDRSGPRSQTLKSIVGVSRFEDGDLVEVRIYPIELGYEGPNSRLGIPRLVHGALGREILETVQRLSRELGTEIEIEGDVGVIRAGGAAAGGGG